MPPESEPRTLDLRDYMRVVRRFKWTIAVTVVLTVAAALAMAYREAPVYLAQARVLVTPRFAEEVLSPQEGVADPKRAIANEIQVMSSPLVKEEVADKLGRPIDEVRFEALEDTDVVKIAARSDDPEHAAETASVYAETYLEVRRELVVDEYVEATVQIQGQVDELAVRIAELDADLAAFPPPAPVEGERATSDPRQNERNRLNNTREGFIAQLERLQTAIDASQQGGGQLIADASVPTNPINKAPVRNGLAGLGLGLFLGVGLAFLREYLDDSIKTKDDLERTSGISAIGLIPAQPDWKDRKSTPLVAMAEPRSPGAEAYRSLRTSLEFLALDHSIRSVQITSAMAAEGKTTTLANLATTFARAGQRVIVLCCDLRRPRVHEFFGLSNRLGFTSVLLGETTLSDAIQPIQGDLALGLVASGPLPPNPAELLSSDRAAGVIEALSDRCDLLLIDSPPVLPVTDALVVAGHADALLLVANAGGTTKRGLGRAVELLRQVDAPLVGTVLNGLHARSEYGYSYGNEYYFQAEAPRRQPASAKNGRRTRKKARVSS